MVVVQNFLGLLTALLQLTTVTCVCNLTTIGVKDSAFTLSNDQVKADTAEGECVILGGHLATTKDQQTNGSLTAEINRKFGVQRVFMFYNPNDANVYKYSKDSTESGNWKSTKNNPYENLWFIDLYKTWATGRVKVTFCTPSDRTRWLIAVGQAGNSCGPDSSKFRGYIPSDFGGRCLTTIVCPVSGIGWIYDFHLYGSHSATGSQQIYSYRRYSLGSYGSRLTTVRGIYYNNFDKDEINFFSPDVKVFIGAKYSNSRWLWGDGTPANFAAPTTSPSTCLQKAYNPASNTLEDVQCTQTAYYACQVKFTATIEQPECNSNYLIVKWNDNLSKLSAATGNNNNTVSLNMIEHHALHVVTPNNIVLWKHSMEASASFNLPYKQSLAHINGLKARTSYLSTIQAKFSGCNNFTLTNQMTTTTGYGLPDQVTTAHIVSSDPCILAISQPTNDRNITSYTVTATGNTRVTEHNFNNTFKSVEAFQIPLTGHQEKQRINVTIRANSCEGSGNKSSLSGFCVSPKSASTPVTSTNGSATSTNPLAISTTSSATSTTGSANNAEPSNHVGIIVGSSVGLLLLIAIIIIAVIAKKKNAKPPTVQEPATTQSHVVYSNQPVNLQATEGDYMVPEGMQLYEEMPYTKRV